MMLSLSSLGYPDSNQERQDQNLQCYHYTIAQSIVANSSFAHAKVCCFSGTTKPFV